MNLPSFLEWTFKHGGDRQNVLVVPLTYLEESQHSSVAFK
jgi:hypothetical protein